MLSILGRPTTRGSKSGSGFCDGLARRDFLTIGGMAMGGIALPSLLQREAAAGLGKSHKAIINIFLPGGPPHQDMFDIKADAPSETQTQVIRYCSCRLRGEPGAVPCAVRPHRRAERAARDCGAAAGGKAGNSYGKAPAELSRVLNDIKMPVNRVVMTVLCLVDA